MTAGRPLRAYLVLYAVLAAAEGAVLCWAAYTRLLPLSWWQFLGLAFPGAVACDLVAHYLPNYRRRPKRRRAHARPTKSGGTP